MILYLLRWISGFVDFSVSGRFPERFLNLCAKNGINLWKMNGQSECFTARARNSDIAVIELLAKKTQMQLHISARYGLPHYIGKYRERAGLFVGAVLFTAICSFFSGYIWSIEVNVPDGINEYEIRRELSECGLSEGVPLKDIDVKLLKTNMQIKDQRISWITINLFGTRAVVDLNQNIFEDKNKEEEISDNITSISNLISKADGTVTRIEVQNGSAAVKAGDGIQKGQLLVSGVMVYTNGNNVIAQSRANIYAKTSGKVNFEIPIEFSETVISDNAVTKREISILGLEIPLTFCGNPDCKCLSYKTKEQLTIGGNTVPVYFEKETLKEISSTEKRLDEKTAKKILDNRAKLYQVFLLYSQETTKILSFNPVFTKNENSYIYTANYEIEENVCISPQ